eukprot:7291558-Ditylum_brightwellii.AAC.1
MDMAKKHLDDKGVKDYHVPSADWVAWQFLPNQPTRKTAERFTGVLNVQQRCQQKNARISHPHGH